MTNYLLPGQPAGETEGFLPQLRRASGAHSFILRRIIVRGAVQHTHTHTGMLIYDLFSRASVGKVNE
jgi:hypothetical protein